MNCRNETLAQTSTLSEFNANPCNWTAIISMTWFVAPPSSGEICIYIIIDRVLLRFGYGGDFRNVECRRFIKYERHRSSGLLAGVWLYNHSNFCVVDFYVTMFSVLFGFILMERLMNISIEKSSVVY